MKNGLIKIVLMTLIVLFLSGCSMYEGEYSSVSVYEPEPESVGAEDGDGYVSVTNYSVLRANISSLVTVRGENMRIVFKDYEGEVAEDLAVACKEVSTNTALGLYSVDYITYSIERIVSYDEAEIFVSYSKTEEEIEGIEYGYTTENLVELVERTMWDFDDYLAVSVTAAELSNAMVYDIVAQASYGIPTGNVEKPDVLAQVYDAGGAQKIVELRFSYDSEEELLERKREDLAAVLLEAYKQSDSADGYEVSRAAYTQLVENVRYDVAGGTTAYDALVHGAANSEGMAIAYAAITELSGMECYVVSGRHDNELHYWNIVKIEDAYFHVDSSRALTDGEASTLLMADSQMWDRYWWDTEHYPDCDVVLNGRNLDVIVPEKPIESAEPTQSPSPTETVLPTESMEPTDTPVPTGVPETPDVAEPTLPSEPVATQSSQDGVIKDIF